MNMTVCHDKKISQIVLWYSTTFFEDYHLRIMEFWNPKTHKTHILKVSTQNRLIRYNNKVCNNVCTFDVFVSINALCGHKFVDT